MTNFSCIIATMLISVFLQGCSKESESPGIARIDYNGDELRIGGYYYFDNPAGVRDIIFLYGNGIVLYAGGNIPELASIEDSFRDGSFYSGAKERQYNWGVFQVYGDKIMIDNWYVQVGTMRIKSFSAIGDIFDNETFRINDFLGRTQTYQFKEFDNKPDSVCRFIL